MDRFFHFFSKTTRMLQYRVCEKSGHWEILLEGKSPGELGDKITILLLSLQPFLTLGVILLQSRVDRLVENSLLQVMSLHPLADILRIKNKEVPFLFTKSNLIPFVKHHV